MFQISIVVFREVLEIAIILGVILAATKGVASRQRWVWLGIGLGLTGSFAVAYFINEISSMAEGVGQEIFNAGILIIASLVIGWTVLWMRSHARQMVERLKRVGEGIKEGNIHMFSITVVIALAFLREGSEIVLFGNGILLAGKISIPEFTTGCVLGLVSGSIVGALLYFGLIKIPTKYIFQITSWLLIFLAAGMMSIAASYLVSAGIFDVLVEPVWDTSSILPDGSLVGRFLAGLIGYTAMPMGIQLVFYILTLGVLAVSSSLVGRKSYVKKAAVAASLAVVMVSLSSVEALATKKVYAPYVEQGELEFEYKGGYTIDKDRTKDGEEEHKFAVGYGFTDYWFSEIYAEIKNDAGDNQPNKLEAIEWENRFQLTQAGEYWADFGLLAEYEFAVKDGEAPDEIKILALIEKDFGKFANIINFGFEKQVGENSDEGAVGIVNWLTRYRLMPEFEPGIEIYSNFGELDEDVSYSEQSHQIGPVVHGELGHGISYDVGYLFGISQSAPDGEIKFLLEYGIPLN